VELPYEVCYCCTHELWCFAWCFVGGCLHHAVVCAMIRLLAENSSTALALCWRHCTVPALQYIHAVIQKASSLPIRPTIHPSIHPSNQWLTTLLKPYLSFSPHL
jgi:hypothetical protein